MSRFDTRRSGLALAAFSALALVLDGRLGKGSGTPLGVDVALALVTCAPLAFRERAPLASVLLLEAGLVVCAFTFHPYDAAIGILTVVLFLATMRGDRRRSLIVGVVTAPLLTLMVVLLQTDGRTFEASAIAKILLVLSAIILGDTVRSRRALRAVTEERAAHERREREERARQRVERERLRIARELHDTLAHALVGINVRAGVAAHLGAGRADAAAMTEIKHVSAQALRDLRATLDLLRDGRGDAPRLPAQGMESLAGLIEGVRSAGLDAHADIRINGSDVSTSVGQTAFRVVQEALTNVLRHAHASRADVTVIARSEVLTVRVEDDGVGGGASGEGAVGHGLRGMSERVLALGGKLTAGPVEPRGWRVLAELPLNGGVE